MTTITTAHHRTPLVATLAASAALVVGGALGVTWAQNHDDTTTAPSPQVLPTTAEPFGGVTTSQEISGAVDGHLSQPSSFGGSTTGQESTQ